MAINFYRGLAAKFNPDVHGEGIFFSIDTGEIFANNLSYGEKILDYEYDNGKLTLKTNSGRDIEISIPEATAQQAGLLSPEDKTRLTNLDGNLDDKVDKVSGKSLVLDTEITKLAGLPNSTELTDSIGTAKAAGDNAQSDLNSHKQNTSNPHSVNKEQVGLGNVTNDAQVKRSEMGQANGVATLDENAKVPAAQLPSYVDDVLEYDDKTEFPTSGESGKIYVAKDTNLTYRWSGSAYVEISQSLALGETSTTAYAGDKGKANAEAIANVKNTQLSHISDTNTFTTTTLKVTLNYTCFSGDQYGATGTSHTADIPAVTTDTAGVMTSNDKKTLDRVKKAADSEDFLTIDDNGISITGINDLVSSALAWHEGN